VRKTIPMVDNRTQEEKAYSFDLDVFGYSGKWKVAKEMAHGLAGVEFWMTARLRFIELGGEYLTPNQSCQSCWCHYYDLSGCDPCPMCGAGYFDQIFPEARN
jgi:hypothetical protein